MGFSDFIQYYWVDQADPRTADWFLVGTTWPIFIIIFNYLYFVLKCGPEFMQNRKPYSLKTFIKWYNIFQIVANIGIIFSLIKAGWFTTITIGCEPITYTMEPKEMFLAKIMWWTYMLKLLDFIETGVFILRKKNQQVSFLHLYHHVSTVLIAWLTTKYIAGGMVTFTVLLNSGVHVIMYSYYYGSCHSSSTIRALVSPIKRYITIIQMVQFLILIAHTAQSLCPRCIVPRLPGSLFIINLLINLYLFYDFYRKNYKNKAKAH